MVGTAVGLSGPARLRLVVLASLALGGASSAAVAVAWPSTGLGVPLSLALALLAVTTVAELVHVRLRHGDQTEDLTLFEAAVVVDVLVLPPLWAVALPIVALAVASLIARRSLVKGLFNLGTYAASTSAMVALVHLVTGDAAPLGPRSVLGILLGCTAFAVVNLCCLARVLAVVTGTPARQVIAEGIRLSALMAAGNAAVGAVCVAIASTHPTLLPFTALPAAALMYAYRATAQEADERERSARLVALSRLLGARHDRDQLLTSFCAEVRSAFRVDAAVVVLTPEPGAWPVTAHADALGVTLRFATEQEAALITRAAQGSEVLATGRRRTAASEGLPDGWQRALVAPVESDGEQVGVLVLGATTSNAQPQARDGGLLSALASGLGSALRSAEHLNRLVEESSKLQAVVDHSSEGIYVLDAGGRVLVWNPAMTAVTGVSSRAALGRRLDEVVSATLPDGRVHAVGEVLAGLQAAKGSAPQRVVVDVEVHRTDGELRRLSCSYAGIPDEDGRLARAVVLAHDVTRERRVDRLKADFVATVSHELRTPLTPIKGYVDLLRRRGDVMTPEKRIACLDAVSDRVAHLARLVEDLLLASRISDDGDHGPTVECTTDDLVRLVARSVADFADAAPRMHVSLPVDAVLVSCDATRVVQVVNNLVGNALKYSAPEAPVTVGLTIEGDRAVLRVVDRGLGIPADQLERVFEKFHRVEDPMTMSTGGTGLGLYVARRLAEAMGGAVTVSSVLGKGSTFALSLPLVDVDSSAAAAPTDLPVPSQRVGPPAHEHATSRVHAALERS